MDASREGLDGHAPQGGCGGVIALYGGVNVVQPNAGRKRTGINTGPLSVTISPRFRLRHDFGLISSDFVPISSRFRHDFATTSPRFRHDFATISPRFRHDFAAISSRFRHDFATRAGGGARAGVRAGAVGVRHDFPPPSPRGRLWGYGMGGIWGTPYPWPLPVDAKSPGYIPYPIPYRAYPPGHTPYAYRVP